MAKHRAPSRTAHAGKSPGWSSPPGCRLTEADALRFGQGTLAQAYEKLGAHRSVVGGIDGVAFTVWAPNAKRVSVVGDFNAWNAGAHALAPLQSTGVWSGFVPQIGRGALYKYHIESRAGGAADKADPYALRSQTPPDTASVVWDPDHAWSDAAWIRNRAAHQGPTRPMSVYEMHLGSWRRPAAGRHYGYREIADTLIPYLGKMNFTHVEFLPPKEHPYYGSWGYQTTGFFAATSRYGPPEDLMYLIDRLHGAGIGVIVDWVASHFPTDEHGIGFFDGTHLYEHADPRQGYHPDWKSFIFNYGRGQVRSFLVSSAMFWLDRFHVDALRVDAVASMLYRDYSRNEGEWIPNKFGGRENLEAIAFLRQLNDTVHEAFPGVLTIAEESTTWPMVSRPTYVGGLGFDMKWDMGWMHDTLEYMALDPIHRKFNHDKLTFRAMYAHSENFVLPLSHDEVVHGKGSLIGKMPGDPWQRFASLRTLLGYMHGQPGKKLLFMGAEIGQWREWDHEGSLGWDLLEHPLHAGLQRWVADLNALHRDEPALHRGDFSPSGFAWIDCSDADQSVVGFLRRGGRRDRIVAAACNFTPVIRYNYRLGLPCGGNWDERLNSDATEYGGSGVGNLGRVEAVAIRYHGQPFSAILTLPPLAIVFLVGPAPR